MIWILHTTQYSLLSWDVAWLGSGSYKELRAGTGCSCWHHARILFSQHGNQDVSSVTFMIKGYTGCSKSTRPAQVEGILSLLLQAWEESQAAEAAREAEEAQLFKTKPRVADMTSQEARGLTVECIPVNENRG